MTSENLNLTISYPSVDKLNVLYWLEVEKRILYLYYSVTLPINILGFSLGTDNINCIREVARKLLNIPFVYQDT